MMLFIFKQIFISVILVPYCLVKYFIEYFKPSCFRFNKSIKGELVLITGAGNEFGLLLSKKIAKLGANLVLLDTDNVIIQKIANEVRLDGANVSTVTCDMTKDDIYRVADKIKKKIGDVNILINNFGVINCKTFLESSETAIEKKFQINTMAYFWLGKAFFPSMIEKNYGHIVTISNVSGLFSIDGLCDYSASKFAIISFEESLRNELNSMGKTGINTTLVCHFYIKSKINELFSNEYISFLDSDYVTTKIVEAVLTNQKFLFLPHSIYILYILKRILPIDVSYHLCHNVFKLNGCIENFIENKRKLHLENYQARLGLNKMRKR